MLYKVMARTKRTDWVEMKTFNNENAAKSYAKRIVSSDAGTEVCIETQEQKK